MSKNSSLDFDESEPKYQDLKQLLDSYQAKQYDVAERLALSITRNYPGHPFAWKLLGALFNQTGRATEALDACQKAVLLEPNSSESHNNLGNTLYKLDRLADAESSYKESIKIDPNNALAQFNLAQAQDKSGKLEEAVTSYKEAIALKHNYVEAYSNLGVALKSLGRLTEAEAAYSFAIEINKDFVTARLNRGQLFFEKGDFELALGDFDLCNNPISRARALAVLYALGRTDEIYHRIESQPEEDNNNLRIAAIASFIAQLDKRESPHNFCNNPLDFIYFSNISHHRKNSNTFIKKLIEELTDVSVVWEPFNKATQKGFQSTTNLFKNPLGKVRQLESIIIDELDSYFSKFKHEKCIYMEQWPSNKRLIGWHVILKKNGNQNAHIHPSGWLSGVIYLKAVPNLGTNEGAIEFSLNGKHYFHNKSPNFVYDPKDGDIVFFPSSLHHKTIPFTSDEDRIVVAFDLLPKDSKDYV